MFPKSHQCASSSLDSWIGTANCQSFRIFLYFPNSRLVDQVYFTQEMREDAFELAIFLAAMFFSFWPKTKLLCWDPLRKSRGMGCCPGHGDHRQPLPGDHHYLPWDFGWPISNAYLSVMVGQSRQNLISELLVVIFVTTRGELSENKIHTEEERARKSKRLFSGLLPRWLLDLSMT